MAFAGWRWIGSGAGVPELVREQAFFHNTVLAECAVLAVLCLLHAAFYGMGFFTRSRPRYMYTRMGPSHGTCDTLYLLAPRLVELIRTVGVEDILRGTESQAQHAEKILNRIGGTARYLEPRFVRYN